LDCAVVIVVIILVLFVLLLLFLFLFLFVFLFVLVVAVRRLKVALCADVSGGVLQIVKGHFHKRQSGFNMGHSHRFFR